MLGQFAYQRDIYWKSFKFYQTVHGEQGITIFERLSQRASKVAILLMSFLVCSGMCAKALRLSREICCFFFAIMQLIFHREGGFTGKAEYQMIKANFSG